MATTTELISTHLRVDWTDRLYLDLEGSAWTDSSSPRVCSGSRSGSSGISLNADAGADPDRLFLGFIDRDPRWPAEELGPEPTWFLTEVGDLLDRWNDRETDTYKHMKGDVS